MTGLEECFAFLLRHQNVCLANTAEVSSFLYEPHHQMLLHAEMLKSHKKKCHFSRHRGTGRGGLAGRKHLYRFCHRMIFFLPFVEWRMFFHCSFGLNTYFPLRECKSPFCVWVHQSSEKFINSQSMELVVDLGLEERSPDWQLLFPLMILSKSCWLEKVLVRRSMVRR